MTIILEIARQNNFTQKRQFKFELKNQRNKKSFIFSSKKMTEAGQKVDEIIEGFENMREFPPPPQIDDGNKVTVTKETLNCKICMEMYFHPIMLPCQHTYCFKCIVKACQ